MTINYLYRADEHLSGFNFDEDGDALPFTSSPQVRVALRSYMVVRYTTCGAWISLGFGEQKFVNLKARKRWACPTREEAIESFLARKRRQLRILDHQWECACSAIKHAESGKVDDQTGTVEI